MTIGALPFEQRITTPQARSKVDKAGSSLLTSAGTGIEPTLLASLCIINQLSSQLS